MITSYTVYIRHKDGVTFSTDLTNCDGSQSAVIVSTTCSIPIDNLRASPFLYNWGDSVYAKVMATNIVGNSNVSTVGNGA